MKLFRILNCVLESEVKSDLVGADPVSEAHHVGFDVAHRHRVAAALLPEGRLSS